MLNGKKLGWDAELGQKIVDLRKAGHTWKSVDAILFFGLRHKDQRCGSFAGDFAQKHRRAHPEMDGAFSKALIGGFSPLQIVVPLQKFETSETAQALKECLAIA